MTHHCCGGFSCWAPILMMMMMPLLAFSRMQSLNSKPPFNFTWPAKKAADVEGDLILGGLMMIHERQDDITCGPVMPQGGIQVNFSD
jgi:metabotropic X receptor